MFLHMSSNVRIDGPNMRMLSPTRSNHCDEMESNKKFVST